MSVTVWLQQSEHLDDCDCVISAEWMLRHQCCGCVPRATAWSCKKVELWMSLWRTWEVYERFTFIVSAKEYRSISDVTRIEKINTNVARQLTCFKQPQVPDNGLASSNDLHSMEVDWYLKKLYFWRFHIFRNAKNWACNSSPVAQWLHSKLCLSHLGQNLNDIVVTFLFICNFEEQNKPFAPIFREYLNEMWIRWYFWVCYK